MLVDGKRLLLPAEKGDTVIFHRLGHVGNKLFVRKAVQALVPNVDECFLHDVLRVVAVGTTSLRTLESAADRPGHVVAGARDTALFITPGYEFKIVDSLVTNFHLPKSTLLMLVSALVGRQRILEAYRHAVESRYRFFSYGDACFLERDPEAAHSID